jgi:hypothetical protein
MPSATSDSSTIAASPASATPDAPLLAPSLDGTDEGTVVSAKHFVITTEIGVSAMRFRYEETDLGVLQDKESGSIPGVSLKLGLRYANWEWETAGSYQQGKVSYFMPPAAGGPYNARTNETIGDASLRLGYWLGEQQSFMPFVGIGYHRWDRNILPGTMSGLFESYQWKYAWIGSKWMAYQDGPSNLIFDVGLLRPLSPKMKADYRAIYNDEPVFYLNGETGLRMMLTYNFAISQHVGLRMEPYYENWKLGQSQTIPEGIYTLHEPSSTTQNIGLNLRLGWAM